MIQIITNPCPMCGKTHKLKVHADDYKRFIRREGLAQECFPYIKPEDREMLISGICPECWNKMFN